MKDKIKNWFPIHYAVSKSRIPIIEFILQNSSSDMINLTDSYGDTPLHIAIKHGKTDSLVYLLDNGADTNIKNKSFIAPIHQCIYDLI